MNSLLQVALLMKERTARGTYIRVILFIYRIKIM